MGNLELLKLLTLLISSISLIPAFTDEAIEPSPMIAHFKQVQSFWSMKMPDVPKIEVADFSRESYIGCEGDQEAMACLAGISIMECGGGERLNHKWAFLGCHHRTMEKGSKELGDDLKFEDMTLSYRIRAASRRFYVLYKAHGEEHAIREWNLGRKWRYADRYYAGVEHFAKIYREVGH